MRKAEGRESFGPSSLFEVSVRGIGCYFIAANSAEAAIEIVKTDWKYCPTPAGGHSYDPEELSITASEVGHIVTYSEMPFGVLAYRDEHSAVNVTEAEQWPDVVR